MTAFRYEPASKSTNRTPPSSSRYCVTWATTSHVWRWKGVRRSFGRGRGKGRPPMAAIVVVMDARRTDLRPGSLNVFIRQSVPPQLAAVGVVDTRSMAAAAAAVAAMSRAAMRTASFMDVPAAPIVRLTAPVGPPKGQELPAQVASGRTISLRHGRRGAHGLRAQRQGGSARPRASCALVVGTPNAGIQAALSGRAGRAPRIAVEPKPPASPTLSALPERRGRDLNPRRTQEPETVFETRRGHGWK